MAAHSLVTDPDISLDVLQHVAEVDGAVGVRIHIWAAIYGAPTALLVISEALFTTEDVMLTMTQV
jgi:MinD superfamily P-loop ATPase